MLADIFKAVCTKRNLVMAASALVGLAAVATAATSGDTAESAEPEFDFDRDVYRNPEFFKEVMEDTGIWEPEAKV